MKKEKKSLTHDRTWVITGRLVYSVKLSSCKRESRERSPDWPFVLFDRLGVVMSTIFPDDDEEFDFEDEDIIIDDDDDDDEDYTTYYEDYEDYSDSYDEASYMDEPYWDDETNELD